MAPWLRAGALKAWSSGLDAPPTLPFPEGLDVRERRTAQSFEVVAALEGRDNPALGVPVGDRGDGPRRPGEVRLLQALPAAAHRVAHVGVEAGGDQDQVRREG